MQRTWGMKEKNTRKSCYEFANGKKIVDFISFMMHYVGCDSKKKLLFERKTEQRVNV